jgi:hypothetical protein
MTRPRIALATAAARNGGSTRELGQLVSTNIRRQNSALCAETLNYHPAAA